MAKPTTVRLDDTLTSQLDTLAAATDRTKAWHIERAIRAYIADELAFIEGIKRGQEDAKAGRVTDWDDFEKELDTLIEGHPN